MVEARPTAARGAFRFRIPAPFGNQVVNEFGFSRINIFSSSLFGDQSGREFLQSVGLTNLGGREVPDSSEPHGSTCQALDISFSWDRRFSVRRKESMIRTISVI